MGSFCLGKVFYWRTLRTAGCTSSLHNACVMLMLLNLSGDLIAMALACGSIREIS